MPAPQLDSVVAGNEAIVQVNANFQSVESAAYYGRQASESNGLTFGYYGAVLQDGTEIASDTVTVGTSTTTYLVVDRATGAVSSSTSTTNWNDTADYMRMAKLVSNGSQITSYEDWRPLGGLESGGGGGGGTVDSVVAGTGIDVDATDPANPEVSLDSATQASLALADSAVQSVVAGTNVTVDNTDPQNPVISASGGGGSGTVTSVSVDVDATLTDLIADSGNPVTSSGTITLAAVDAGSDKVAGWDDSAGKATYFALTYGLKSNGTDIRGALQTLAVALSDRTTNLTTGTNKGSFTMPYDFTVVEAYASVDTQQTAGPVLTFDVNEGGSSILSTKITIDNNEDSSLTAATPPVISDASLAKGAKITWDIDQVGTAGAKGAIGYLVGYPT